MKLCHGCSDIHRRLTGDMGLALRRDRLTGGNKGAVLGARPMESDPVRPSEKGHTMAQDSNASRRDRRSAEQARDQAMIRVRRATTTIGVAATAGAIGLGVLVATDTIPHSAPVSSGATPTTSGGTAATTTPTTSGSSQTTTPSAPASSASTTTTTQPTTTTHAPVTVSGQS